MDLHANFSAGFSALPYRFNAPISVTVMLFLSIGNTVEATRLENLSTNGYLFGT